MSNVSMRNSIYPLMFSRKRSHHLATRHCLAEVLQRKLFGLVWKQVRNILEMSIIFNLCSGVNVLGNHFADRLLIRQISVKAVWTDVTLSHRPSTISNISRCYTSQIQDRPVTSNKKCLFLTATFYTAVSHRNTRETEWKVLVFT